MERQSERRFESLDEEWLDFLIEALTFFDDPEKFTRDITDSLLDAFMFCLGIGGRNLIQQI